MNLLLEEKVCITIVIPSLGSRNLFLTILCHSLQAAERHVAMWLLLASAATRSREVEQLSNGDKMRPVLHVRKTTRDTLKLVAVLSHESMGQTIDRLARQELARLQQRQGKADGLT